MFMIIVTDGLKRYPRHVRMFLRISCKKNQRKILGRNRESNLEPDTSWLAVAYANPLIYLLAQNYPLAQKVHCTEIFKFNLFWRIEQSLSIFLTIQETCKNYCVCISALFIRW